MSGRGQPIAVVRLRRSVARLVAVPVAGGLGGATALLGGVALAGADGVALALAGLVAMVFSLWLGVLLLTLRLEVDAAAVRIRWLGGQRRHRLTRGAVTRIAGSGPAAPRVRVRFGALGWGVGEGLLRDTERIEVVRLAPGAPLILLPGEAGRLALAPEDEAELLGALAAAVRVQARIAAAARESAEAAPLTPPAPSTPPVQSMPTAPTTAWAPIPSARSDVSPPRLLTGVERAFVEDRLAAEWTARERAAAEAREAAARAAAEAELAAAAPTPAAVEQRPVVPARSWPRLRPALRRPSWAVPRAVQRRRIAAPRRALVNPWVAVAMLLPSAASGLAWLLINLGPLPSPSELRQIVLALVLAGPAASAAAVITRFTAPQLTGPVVIAALVALILIGRALVG